jgi:replication factor C large subunit
MLPLIRKYMPKSSKEIIGQNEAVAKLNSFISNYKKQKKKAALIYGPSGTGKTSSVYALGHEHNLEIFELNASDFRNKEQINAKLGSSIKQQSLFSRGKLILIDDVDGLSGTEDRGALPEIISLMEKSGFPIILTAIDPYDDKLASLRSKSEMIKYEAVPTKEIVPYLMEICKKEKLHFREDVAKAIAGRSGGDLRAAINDLEILSLLKGEVTKESLEELGMREKEDTIFNALIKVFKTTDPKLAISAFDYVSEDIDEQMLWIDENLPKEYDKPADLARAYRKLSRADIFRGRIKRWQHWHFLVYVSALISAGVATAKDERYNKFVEYKRTGRILKLWWAKQKSMKKKSIAGKIAGKTHTSVREVIKSMPYYQAMFKKNKKFAEKMIGEFSLDDEEVEWLRK